MLKFINYQNKYWQWGLLVFLALIWGSSFILMKKGLVSYSSNQVAAFRVAFSFFLFLPFAITRFKRVQRDQIKALAIVGFMGNGIPAVLFTTAQTQISSSLAGMLNSLTPFFTLVVGVWMYKSTTKWYNVLGILIGLLGALGLIVKQDAASILDGINSYAILAVIATICYGISTNETKYKLSDLDGLTIAAMAFMFTGPIAVVYLLFSDFSQVVFDAESLKSLGYIFMLASFSSVLAIVIFNNLIKFTTAIFAASVTYIIPIFAIVWGLFDGELVSVSQFFWMTVVLLGVYLVNKKEPLIFPQVIEADEEKKNVNFLYALILNPFRKWRNQ